MNTVKVRDIEIGAGAPKIIVPIVGVTKNDIIEEAKTFHSIPVDVVEWRVDWFEGVFDFAQVEDVLKDLREALGNIPLLMTFRTSKEGGEKAMTFTPAACAPSMIFFTMSSPVKISTSTRSTYPVCAALMFSSA